MLFEEPDDPIMPHGNTETHATNTILLKLGIVGILVGLAILGIVVVF